MLVVAVVVVVVEVKRIALLHLDSDYHSSRLRLRRTASENSATCS